MMHIKRLGFKASTGKLPGTVLKLGFSGKSTSENESYTQKQARLGRPVSPHVSIYRFPPVALSSIATRLTGIALSIGLTGIGGMALANMDTLHFMQCVGNYPVVGSIAKFSVAFPFVFHYLSGVRHYFWNENPDLLTSDQVEKSSFTLLATSVLISGGVSMVTLL